MDADEGVNSLKSHTTARLALNCALSYNSRCTAGRCVLCSNPNLLAIEYSGMGCTAFRQIDGSILLMKLSKC
jgi:hypothetical protein